MKKYRYSGPLSGVTLDDGREVMLHPGREVELPPEHEYTQTLLALNYLSPLPASPAQPPKKGAADGR